MAEATAEKKIATAMKAMDEGDFKKAYTAFKKLTAEFPDNAEVWYCKAESGNFASGMAGAKIGIEEIIEAYNKAIELDPERVDYYQPTGSSAYPSTSSTRRRGRTARRPRSTSPCPRPCTASSPSSTTTQRWQPTGR